MPGLERDRIAVGVAVEEPGIGEVPPVPVSRKPKVVPRLERNRGGVGVADRVDALHAHVDRIAAGVEVEHVGVVVEGGGADHVLAGRRRGVGQEGIGAGAAVVVGRDQGDAVGSEELEAADR